MKEVMKVLVVDNNESNVRLDRFYLQSRVRHDVTVATNGNLALSVLRESSGLDLIIAAQQIGEPNGLAVLAAARVLFPEAKTILVHAVEDESLISAGKQLGITQFTPQGKLETVLENLEIIPRKPAAMPAYAGPKG